MIIALAVCGCALNPQPQPVVVTTCEVHGELLTEQVVTVWSVIDPGDWGLARAELFPHDHIVFGEVDGEVETTGHVCAECQRARVAFIAQRREARANRWNATICAIHGERLTRRFGSHRLSLSDDEQLARAEFFPNDGIEYLAPGQVVQMQAFSVNACVECVRARTAFHDERRETRGNHRSAEGPPF